MSIDDRRLANLSAEDALPIGSLDCTTTEADQHLLERVRAILDSGLIAPHDADVAELIFFRGLSQHQVGAIFGLQQPSVSHCVHRVTARIRFLLSLPRVDFEEMRRDLAVHPVLNPRRADMIVAYCQTHSQTLAARQLGTTQSMVGRWVWRALDVLRGAEGRLATYHELLDAIVFAPRFVPSPTSLGRRRRTGCVID